MPNHCALVVLERLNKHADDRRHLAIPKKPLTLQKACMYRERLGSCDAGQLCADSVPDLVMVDGLVMYLSKELMVDDLAMAMQHEERVEMGIGPSEWRDEVLPPDCMREDLL